MREEEEEEESVEEKGGEEEDESGADDVDVVVDVVVDADDVDEPDGIIGCVIVRMCPLF